MPYTTITFAQAKSALALRLDDPTNVHWSDTELGLYLTESLRTWNVGAAYYRDRAVFPTAAAQPWYDLGAVAPSQFARTVTDQSLFQLIEYHLYEPPTTPYSGSEQFTQADIAQALQRRLNQFLLETSCVLDHSTISGAFTGGRINLPQDVLEVRRLSFLDTNGQFTHLWREDERNLSAYLPGWSGTPSLPLAYSLSVTPPVSIQLAPPPSLGGVLDAITVRAGPALDPNSGVALNVPNDFAWVIKWGALADLLGRDGPAFDPSRSAYCQERWDSGIQLVRLSTTCMTAYIDGQQIQPDSAFDLDTAYSGWENNPPSTPFFFGQAGLNLIALANPPDGVHSVQIDALVNFPVPVADGDFLQIGREFYDVILDYSEHLAAFKMGGAEFEATAQHYQRIVALAMQQNARWRAVGILPGDLDNRGRRDFRQVRSRDLPQLAPTSANMEGGI